MRLRGIVKGKTIVLDNVAGLSEGQGVEVDILGIEEETKNAGNLKGTKEAWSYVHLPSDRFRSLTEIDFADVEIRVTVINADD